MNKTTKIVDSILSNYKTQLDSVMSDHERMLEKSRGEMAALIEQSNNEILKLTAQVQVEEIEVKPVEPSPETAWVKDHLVLNPQAVKKLNDMFQLFKDILPEIAEAV